ncbi:MAG: hypothetical protein VX663_07630 [Pseudomonadota bacterium]|nr:hypothetical protein [Pseudomonadota bacterium]
MSLFASIRRLRTGWLILASVMICLTLATFANNGTFGDSRPLRATWETGHILLFFCVAWGMGIWLGNRHRPSPLIQVLLLLGVTVVVGGLLELLQGAMGRAGSPSLADMRRNVIGALTGLAFVYPLRGLAPNRRRVLQLLTVLVLSAELWPMLSLWRDDLAARRAFPVLSDFEHRAQSRRWTRGVVIQWGDRGGVFQVALSPKRYSGTQFILSNRDWSGYHTLALSLYNPSEHRQVLWITLRDELSQRNRGLVTDRFTTGQPLEPGWNELRIDLEAARQLPNGRRLALDNLRQLNLFIERPQFPFFLLDDVHLTQ